MKWITRSTVIAVSRNSRDRPNNVLSSPLRLRQRGRPARFWLSGYLAVRAVWPTRSEFVILLRIGRIPVVRQGEMECARPPGFLLFLQTLSLTINMKSDEIAELISMEPWRGVELQMCYGDVIKIDSRDDVVVNRDIITVLRDSTPCGWIATDEVRDVRAKGIFSDEHGLFGAVERCRKSERDPMRQRWCS